MRVWVDVAHPPQVRFFEPVVARLRELEHEVTITARDHRETLVLAREVWPDVIADGADSPSGRARKGLALAERAVRLTRLARSMRPEVALSHNSYAQIVAARLARVPSVTAMDYEHQPANHVAFRLATAVVVPAVFPDEALRRFGARARKVRRYQGLKEEMYLEVGAAIAQPDETVLPIDEPFAVVRLPPEGALYHRGENVLVDDAVSALHARGLTVAVLGRSVEQRAAWRTRSLDGVVVLEPPVDTRALLLRCAAFVGAGGTMTREAALLGAPSFSIFAGPPAAADGWLVSAGRLTVLESAAAVARLGEVQLERLPPALLDREEGPLATLLAAMDAVRR